MGWARTCQLCDGEDTVVNLFVANDEPHIACHLIEYATVCNEHDNTVSISSIQSRIIIEGGYLIGSHRTQNDTNWVRLMNANSKLQNIDINIVTKMVDVNLSGPWNPKTDARAAHVYCAADKEDCHNKVLCTM